MKFYQSSFSGKFYIDFHSMIISFFIIENKLIGIKRENNKLPRDTFEITFYSGGDEVVRQVMSWLAKNKEFIDYEG